MGLALIFTVLIVAIDQISKFFILKYLEIGEKIPVIENFFSIFHIRNRGAAWGFLSEKEWGISILTLISVVASVLILILILRNQNKYIRFFLSLILGGSIGNLIDRIRFNNVVDFFSLKFGNYYFPVFNVADMSIVIGGILLVIFLIRNQHELNEMVLFSKKEEEVKAEQNDHSEEE